MFLLKVLNASIVVTAFLLPFSQAALAETQLGGINVAEYCLEKYGGDVVLEAKYGIGRPNAYDWKCRLNSPYLGIPAGVGGNQTNYGIFYE